MMIQGLRGAAALSGMPTKSVGQRQDVPTSTAKPAATVTISDARH